MHANHAFRAGRMLNAQEHYKRQQQDQPDIIYNALHCIALIALIALHCNDLHYCIALRCFALHCIALTALHCIRTCLESLVGYPEISQWPLDSITRFQHCIIALCCFALHCWHCMALHSDMS